jgi:hypothetical protein
MLPEAAGLVAGLFTVILLHDDRGPGVPGILLMMAGLILLTFGGQWMARRRPEQRFLGHTPGMWIWGTAIAYGAGIILTFILDIP